MLSIGTVDVHCEERFSQILRIAAWVRWYCWSKLAQLLQRGRYFSNKSEPPEHFESSRCCFNHGCLFQEDGFNFRFNPFPRQALNAPSLICESVICPAMTCRAAFFSLFLAERHWNALDWKSLRQKHQIHPFLVSKLKPKKIMALWNSHQFTRFYMILSSFESFPMIPFSKSDGYPPGYPPATTPHRHNASPTGAPTVIGSPAGCPPDRYQWTHPWLWEHGLWPWLHLRLPWTKKFMGNHGIWITFEKGYYDMIDMIWYYDMIHMMGIYFFW